MEFKSELGNSITIQVKEKDLAEHQGILIVIEGPDSSTTVHVTKKEAEVLREQLSLVLGD